MLRTRKLLKSSRPGAMRRLLLALLFVLVAISVALAYSAVKREQDYRRLVREADMAASQGDGAGAIEALSGAIALRPDAMLPWLRRGEQYRQRGDLTAAARDFRRATMLDPAATRPLEQLGDVQSAMGRHARAAENYEAYLALDDRSPEVLYKLALARFTEGDFEQAQVALTRAVALRDTMAPAHYLLGLCLVQRGEVGDAAQALERAVTLGPAMLVAREELANAAHRLGRSADEVRQLEALVGLEPDRVDRHVALARGYAHAGRTDLAVQTLARARERFPEAPQVLTALGQVWLQVAERNNDCVALSKAVEALRRATARDDTSEALTLNARALLLAGDGTRALAALQVAASRRPVARDTHRLLGDVAERAGRIRIARDALREDFVLAGDDTDARALAARAARVGALSVRLGEHAEAARWYARAVASQPDDVRWVVGLAESLLEAGAVERAGETVDRALARHPADARLFRLRARLQGSAGPR